MRDKRFEMEDTHKRVSEEEISEYLKKLEKIIYGENGKPEEAQKPMREEQTFGECMREGMAKIEEGLNGLREVRRILREDIKHYEEKHGIKSEHEFTE